MQQTDKVKSREAHRDELSEPSRFASNRNPSASKKAGARAIGNSRVAGDGDHASSYLFGPNPIESDPSGAGRPMVYGTGVYRGIFSPLSKIRDRIRLERRLR